jgi:hypothetical protein
MVPVMSITGNVNVPQGGEASIVWSRSAIRLRTATRGDSERTGRGVSVKMVGPVSIAMVSCVSDSKVWIC